MYLANENIAFVCIVAGARRDGKCFAMIMPLRSVFTPYIRASGDHAADIGLALVLYAWRYNSRQSRTRSSKTVERPIKAAFPNIPCESQVGPSNLNRLMIVSIVYQSVADLRTSIPSFSAAAMKPSSFSFTQISAMPSSFLSSKRRSSCGLST